MDSSGNKIEIDIEDLVPNYPNERMSGISKAANFALRFII